MKLPDMAIDLSTFGWSADLPHEADKGVRIPSSGHWEAEFLTERSLRIYFKPVPQNKFPVKPTTGKRSR
ncbi:MAG TPA: hypothetical protein VKJ65_12735, partial [Phycisphaerae bacterium]|nr:hypothetical protein [Phycisphaerae bacterium]